MVIPLEDLEYQRHAVAAVIGVLDGQVRNTFERANLLGIHTNVVDLTPEQLLENKRRVIAANGIPEEDAKLSDDRDICIEMETGTGKTLVYLRTAYELHKAYGLTKSSLSNCRSSRRKTRPRTRRATRRSVASRLIGTSG